MSMSFRTRIFLYVSLASAFMIVCLAGVADRWFTRQHVENSIRDCEELTRLLTLQATDLVLYDDRTALLGLFQSTIDSHPHVIYIFVARNEQVVVHTFDRDVPKDILALSHPGYADFSVPEFVPQWELAGLAMNGQTSMVRGTMAATPLRVAEEVLGVLFVQNRSGITLDPRLLDMFAAQAVNMIHNSQLYKELEIRNIELSKKNLELMDLFGRLSQSEKLLGEFEKLTYSDFLTDLPNRRYLECRMQEEIARSQRHALYMACLMIDIDHFKNVNDTYGHPAGDYILQELAGILIKNKRPYDLVARYGGEEFTMVFKHIHPDDGSILAERIRASVENASFYFHGKIIKTTVSIGVVSLKAGKGDTIETILAMADAALYRAKREGRNRWCATSAVQANA